MYLNENSLTEFSMFLRLFKIKHFLSLDFFLLCPCTTGGTRATVWKTLLYTKVGGSSLTRHLAGLGVNIFVYFLSNKIYSCKATNSYSI
jgi:hypothetical protein